MLCHRNTNMPIIWGILTLTFQPKFVRIKKNTNYNRKVDAVGL